MGGDGQLHEDVGRLGGVEGTQEQPVLRPAIGSHRWDWTAGLEHLVDVLDGATQLIQPAHAFHVLELMLTADRAATTGVEATW